MGSIARFARRKAAHSGVGFALAGVAGQAALVVSGVLVARLLGVEYRGHLALMIVLAQSLATFGGLGMSIAATYQLARVPESATNVVTLVLPLARRRAALLLAVQAVLIVAIFSDEPASVVWAAVIAGISVAACIAQQVGLALLQGQQLFVPFNVLRVLPFVMYAIGIVVVAVLDGGIVAAATVWTAALVIGASITLRKAVRAARASAGTAPVDRGHFLRFGRRGLLGSAFPVETFQLDQTFVGLVLGPSALGLYAVGASFVNLPRFLGQSVGMLAYPRIAAESERRSAVRALVRYSGAVATMCAAVIVVLELSVGFLLPFFFGEEFAPAIPIARILLIGAFFIAMRRVLSDSLRGLGFPRLGSVAELTTWIVLIPTLAIAGGDGPEGVAVAVTLAYAASVAVLAGASIQRIRAPARPPGRSSDDPDMPPEALTE